MADKKITFPDKIITIPTDPTSPSVSGVTQQKDANPPTIIEQTPALASSSNASDPITNDESSAKKGKTEDENERNEVEESKQKDQELITESTANSAELRKRRTKRPPSTEEPPALKAKRKLWDVDSTVVDETLSNELKRIRKEEMIVKSAKWNFDFEREVPLQGAWQWEEEKTPPSFYKQKEVSNKSEFRAADESHSPATEGGRHSVTFLSSNASGCTTASATPQTISSNTTSAASISSQVSPTPSSGSSRVCPDTSTGGTTTDQQDKGDAPSIPGNSSSSATNILAVPPASFYSSASAAGSLVASQGGQSSNSSKRKPKKRPTNGSSNLPPPSQSWVKHFR